MIFALAAGISTNYFAVLAFVPIAAGEIARIIQLALYEHSDASQPSVGALTQVWQAVDLRIWIGLALAAASLLASRSMIALSIAQFAPYAWNKVSLGQVSDSYTQMVEFVLYPLVALLAFTSVAVLLSRRSSLPDAPTFAPESTVLKRVRSSGPLLPAYEAVGVLMLMLYPFIGYVVASIHGGMLSQHS
jgi:hypothetical protein